MSHCNFAGEIKWECVKDMSRILREGDLTRDKIMEFAEHLGCFVGEGAKMLRGPDDLPDDVVGVRTHRDYTADADQLDSMVPVEGDTALASIPWVTIVTIALRILAELLSDDDE